MTQRNKMIKVLKQNVISCLLDNGFIGKFPHYKRIHSDRIELLVFMTNNWGNSFLVEISTVFPNEKTAEMRNVFDFIPLDNIDEIDVFCTNKRFRLKGMFDGWFYYTDLYKSKMQVSFFRKCDFFNAISEKRALNYVPKKSEILVQKSNDDLYLKIAHEINVQMKSAHAWWEKYDTPKKMKKYK